MPKTHVRKGDTVIVLAGKDKGKRGKVQAVDPKNQKVTVEGVNVVKRHTKPRPPSFPQGGILDKNLPIHISNVMVVDPKKNEPTRVRYVTETAKDGSEKKHRVAVKSGERIG